MRNLSKIAYDLCTDEDLAMKRFEEDTAILNFFFDTPIITEITQEVKTNTYAKVNKNELAIQQQEIMDQMAISDGIRGGNARTVHRGVIDQWGGMGHVGHDWHLCGHSETLWAESS